MMFNCNLIQIHVFENTISTSHSGWYTSLSIYVSVMFTNNYRLLFCFILFFECFKNFSSLDCMQIMLTTIIICPCTVLLVLSLSSIIVCILINAFICYSRQLNTH